MQPFPVLPIAIDFLIVLFYKTLILMGFQIDHTSFFSQTCAEACVCGCALQTASSVYDPLVEKKKILNIVFKNFEFTVLWYHFDVVLMLSFCCQVPIIVNSKKLLSNELCFLSDNDILKFITIHLKAKDNPSFCWYFSLIFNDCIMSKTCFIKVIY